MAEGELALRELIPRRELSFVDVITGAAVLVRATIRTAVPAVAVVYAPLAVLSALPPSDTRGGAAPAQPSAEDVVVWMSAAVIAFIVMSLINAALTWTGVAAARGRTLRWTGAYRLALRAIGRITRALVLLGVVSVVVVSAVFLAVGLASRSLAAVAVWTLLLAGPVVMALLSMSFLVVPAVILEGAGGVAAIARSWEVLTVRLWPYLGMIVVAGLIASLADLAVVTAVTPVAAAAGSASFVVQAVASTLVATITLPFVAYVVLLIFVDASTRLEGPDAVPLPGLEPTGG